jgi:hypothetical protein
MAEAAQAIRDVLALVADGKLVISGPAEVALLRRLEGAAVALEEASRS